MFDVTYFEGTLVVCKRGKQSAFKLEMQIHWIKRVCFYCTRLILISGKYQSEATGVRQCI